MVRDVLGLGSLGEKVEEEEGELCEELALIGNTLREERKKKCESS